MAAVMALPGGALGSPRTVFLCSAEDDLLDTIRPRIDAACNRRSAVIVKVIMQRPITRAEALLFQEQRVIKEREGVEDVESCLLNTY